MQPDRDVSLSDEATFAGRPRPQRVDVSIGDERTLGDGLAGQETIIDDIEVIDLAARYKIEGTLGQGGMGAVLLATDTRLDRRVAIKRILGEAAGNRMAVNRFLTEAKSIAALNHPNIVQIYDYGRAEDGPFLIMEFVDGGSLLDRCRDGAMPLEDAVEMACQLCDGLAKAHDLGIIHRDIKPANVLLTKDGTPKLTDFGLAKAQSGDHGQTMTGAVLGTPDFMPPEQRRDAALVDHRSDLWSLAATIYQMLTGRSPKVIRLHELPQALQGVLAKALEDEKEARYQSVRELRDVIKASLRAAASAPAAVAAEVGQCPACGVQNDISRKFCRNCGGSLQAPCLSCDKPMPMWEEICGNCGAKQPLLLESRRSEMAAAQAKAEGLLGDFDFDEATGLATRLRDEPHARLMHLKDWATHFVDRIAKTKADILDRASAVVVEALAHERAADYSAGIRSLEAVPEGVRTHSLPGQGQTVQDVLARLQARLKESTDLERVIRAAVKEKSLTGLLPQVNRFAELRPDRADIKKLQAQLQERHNRLCEQGGSLMAQAREAFARKDYAAALKAISLIDEDAKTAALEPLRSESQSAHDRSSALRDTIKAAVAEQRLDGLLEIVDEYLTLKPSWPDLDKLRAKLVQHAEQRAAEQQARGRRVRRRLIGTACLLAIFGGAGAVAKIGYDRWVAKVAAIERGLTNQTWDSVLKLDPDNVRALIGRAGRKLSDAPLDVEAAIADLDRARQAGAPSEDIQPLLARARGMEAARLASDNNCSAAEMSLAEAVSLGAEDSLVKQVRAKLAKGWQTLCEKAIRDSDTAAFCTACEAARANGAPDTGLSSLWLRFGEQAVERRDGPGVSAAVAGAERCGLPNTTIQSWKASAAALKAVAPDSRTTRTQAIAQVRDALLLDATAVARVLRETKDEGLRDAVVRDCREACAAAMKDTKREEAIHLVSVVGMLDSQSTAWIAETVATMPSLRNSIGMELKLIPAGAFTMGQAGGEADESPHKVMLTKPFYIGVYELTNAQWKRVMGTTPSRWKDDDRPVEQVSWSDAVKFCSRLSERPEEKAHNRVYSLPTEAEWEYACRAGSTTQFSFGDGSSELNAYGWFDKNSGKETHPVGRKKPNAWGLYDMHGNVWEWCSDFYGDMSMNAVTDPRGPLSGLHPVYRGGSWYYAAHRCRSAKRDGTDRSNRYDNVGFRLLMRTSVARATEADESANPTVAAVATKRYLPEPTMVCPGLGHKCTLSHGDWQGVWTRRGDSNVFDCQWRHSVAGETATYVAALVIGKQGIRVQVSGYRSSRVGTTPDAEYAATLSQDGKRLQFPHGVITPQ